MEVVTEKLGRKTPKFNRETVLRDFVRLAWRATQGFSSVAETEAKEIIRRMTDAGRVSRDEGERLMKNLLHRMQGSQKEFENRVEKSVQKAVGRLNEISAKEVDRLGSQISTLESRLEKLSKTKRNR